MAGPHVQFGVTLESSLITLLSRMKGKYLRAITLAGVLPKQKVYTCYLSFAVILDECFLERDVC